MGLDPSRLGSHNLAFAEELYARYLESRDSVDAEWREVFDVLEAERDGERGRAFAMGPSFAVRSIFDPAPDGGPRTPREARPAAARHAISPASVEERVPFLRSLSMFRDVPDAELAEAARIAEEIHLADGEVIVREGEMGEDMFILLEGNVLVRRGGRIIAELGVGEVVGEMAVLDDQPRSADVITYGPARLLRIRGADLLSLLDERPVLAKGLIRVLTRRLREQGSRQDRVDQLIRAYRVRGHLLAEIDPLGLPREVHAELNPAFYGFGQSDLDMHFSVATIPGAHVMTLRNIIAHMQATYCRSIGVQFMHIDDLASKSWLQDRMESTQNRLSLSREQQLRILTKLTDAEIFEQFIHKKFIGAKRFSLEGAETLIPVLDMAIDVAGEHDLDEIVIGMAHRGRLNVLCNIMGKSARQIFHEFEDRPVGDRMGHGDVKYHQGFSADHVTTSGKKVHLSLSFNPSHLECVSPVVLGRVRAKQDRFGDSARNRGMGIIVHGDAAFAGQGVVQETLNLSELEGYGTGGTLHVIVNNQIGFTTDPKDGRSTQYATDVARLLQIPIFHVNGEHPEAVAQAIRLAMGFREEFKKDVVIDMYCYRRFGHNEGDEPAFTQPLLYKTIKKRKSVREGYLDNLYALGQVTPEEAERIAVDRRRVLEEELGHARAEGYKSLGVSSGQGLWRPYKGGLDTECPEVSTAIPADRARALLGKLSEMPDAFSPHPKIERLLAERREMARGGAPLDWAAAELLAYASLLTEGTRVRLSGQDTQRGTFSHRHSVLHDHEDGKTYTPLCHLSPDQGIFEVFNSPLSETAVLGFEYGFSLDYPDGLVIWEAQFGDFVNVAQVIIDQFITSAEDKWRRLSSLVMLLPHAFEGQGPEHSSARLERFLAAAAEDNIQVLNLTTPAQIFHALRRQVVRPWRKPMVIMSPKSLLRHPRVRSTLEEVAGGELLRFIPDAAREVDARRVRRVLLASGKICYELEEARESRGAWDVALVRVEQLYPLSSRRLLELLAAYPAGAELVWAQEEPRNMGAWMFMRNALDEEVLGGRRLRVVARPPSASPATGSASAHKMQQAKLIEEAFA